MEKELKIFKLGLNPLVDPLTRRCENYKSSLKCVSWCTNIMLSKMIHFCNKTTENYLIRTIKPLISRCENWKMLSKSLYYSVLPLSTIQWYISIEKVPKIT